ncbi:hypothetical protein EHEL_061460 [Encephalitozoon hellem ATCC 50504]|uniref:KH domain-containing protein n=1 Tax=Encephalitozoon hellem TaxID=27973 RepID=A0A9Q9CA99_ENCHE|nr:uncharacterized protein EHEL_061460 [Encephalitozoon hellem ATCC 50504]AFM98515.1 hypothetical protein EHEL_061460 [Encephalitozoon hellem ATCC 50504]UTX43442.1 KH domain-containing protein [Encephalitozoon hellem]WEL38907.1 KH domain-containing protein [Encephalitozoon hellem]|eukprot:XP_003887496.1 hypothetical protein EHEL_061460 [Encephalitozoon hellem ATCC 50504]
MEHRRKGLECFAVPEPSGIFLSFIIPLGGHTPKEMVSSMYNGICLDLQKILVGIGRASISKDVGNKVQVSLNVNHRYSIHQMMKLVSKCFRYCYRVEIPLCLYPMKAEITEKMKEIMDATETSICIKIDGKVEAFICGKRRACLDARMKILLMIENAFGRTTEIRRVGIPAKEVVRNGGRVFYHSRINSDECLISHNGAAIDLQEPEKVVERLVLDSQKTAHLLSYKGAEVEDILSDTQSYIDTREICEDYTEVILKGFDLYEVRRAKNKINLLYNSIMKMVVENMKYPSYDGVFILQIKNISCGFMVIGEKQTLLRIVEENGGYVEGEMDIETETVEFLCGKKNGKITRIMRDVCCGIAIHKRPGSTRIHMVISGSSGAFKSALEMIEDEFPEELTFYIDERHHKRIIGYGGKNIQKIMKKHGVYIKFMNERERKRFAYKDNVVIKTPRKNIENLVNMKNDVMGLIGCFRDDSECVETMVSLHDFYDLEYPIYRFLYNEAIIRGSEAGASYYLSESYRTSTGPYHTFKLKNCSQWFIKTTETLPLERVSTVHWLKGIERMSVFSWLFGHGYSSLFNTEREEKVKGQVHLFEVGFLSKK